jgi:Bacterial Ig-like domain (group 3)/Putative Ig domain
MIGESLRRLSPLLLTAFVILATGVTTLGLSATAVASGSETTYLPQSPALDAVSGGPWNTSQGDPSAGAEYQLSDLLPTFIPVGSTTTIGGVTEPNLSVYPAATGATPYPSGVAGTPGPLPGYCSSLGANPEKGSLVAQPAGSRLPMSPYYFPDVLRNADGSLTGYFDYRPKDADEAITVARSTDNGLTWTTEGEALEENDGYCPTADVSDDGQGHPYVTSVAGATDMYTLQRPAGDNTGVGLLVHNVSPTASNPLSSLPPSQPVGVDPNTFATTTVSVPNEGSTASIPVSTLGSAGSPEQIVAGPYEDLSAPSPSSSIITCTGTEASSLTGCTVAGGSPLTVNPNDDLVQVIATANPGTGLTYTIPAGPNIPSGEGGLGTLKFLNGNSTVSPITTYLMNVNAPNRIYIDGQTVYCTQANANPTTKLEDCTTTSSSPLTVHQGDAITADPVLPAATSMTTGLIAPDGIVGTLPSYPGAPSGSTVVLYTEKLLSYFIVGTTNGYVDSSNKFHAGSVTLPASTIVYTPSVTASEPLPTSGPITIYLGTAVGQPIQTVTCSGHTPATQAGVPAGSVDLTGCGGGTGSVAEGNWIGGPNAATVPYSVLAQIGEGTNSKSKGPEKLFGNNEDLTVLRAAYTTDGVNFTDLGPISGSTSGTGNDSGSYNDISNPYQTTSPSSTSPTDLSPGSPDTDELRFVGSRGTIVTNPDGSYGMFLSGAWASDGDSDAFNQIFYSSSSDGQHWSVPKVVLSTDYTFSASATQDAALAEGKDEPLGVSAYYSGRAYGPAVVQNPDGSLTMVFSGYRIPKPIVSAGTPLGTNPSALYTVGSTDPALYRDILTMRLTSQTTPGVATSTSLSTSDEGPGVVGSPVTYTATVAPEPPGIGTPTGTVAFSDSSGPIAGCEARPLNEGSPDTATCATTHEAPGGSDQVTATYSSDANYAASSGSTSETVDQAPAFTSPDSATFTYREAGSFTPTAGGTPAPSIEESGSLPPGVTYTDGTLSGTPTQIGIYHLTFTAHNGVGSDATQQFTLTVQGLHVMTTSLPEVTPGVHYSQKLQAAGGNLPYRWKLTSGTLPKGLKLSPSGVLSGAVKAKTIPGGGSYPITVSVTDNTKKTHQTATASLTVDVS